MDTDVSEVCFFGIYSHNQDAALRSGLAECDVALSEVRVPIRSVEAAKEQRRLPIRTMRGTMAYFSGTPGWLFPILVLGTLIVHLLAMTWTALANVGTLRRADAIVVPHMGDTSVLAAKPIAALLDVPLVYLSHNGLYFTLIENRAFFSTDSVAGRLVKVLDRCCHSWADAVVVFSAESADRFAATMGVDRSRYAVMYIKAVESNFDVEADDSITPAVDVLYWGTSTPTTAPRRWSTPRRGSPTASSSSPGRATKASA